MPEYIIYRFAKYNTHEYEITSKPFIADHMIFCYCIYDIRQKLDKIVMIFTSDQNKSLKKVLK